MKQVNIDVNPAKKNGKGTMVHEDGSTYTGEYQDDLEDGQGTRIYPDGEKYIGGWKDGKKNRQGTTILAKGDKYIGEYKDNKRNPFRILGPLNNNLYVL